MTERGTAGFSSSSSFRSSIHEIAGSDLRFETDCFTLDGSEAGISLLTGVADGTAECRRLDDGADGVDTTEDCAARLCLPRRAACPLAHVHEMCAVLTGVFCTSTVTCTSSLGSGVTAGAADFLGLPRGFAAELLKAGGASSSSTDGAALLARPLARLTGGSGATSITSFSSSSASSAGSIASGSGTGATDFLGRPRPRFMGVVAGADSVPSAETVMMPLLLACTRDADDRMLCESAHQDDTERNGTYARLRSDPLVEERYEIGFFGYARKGDAILQQQPSAWSARMRRTMHRAQWYSSRLKKTA